VGPRTRFPGPVGTSRGPAVLSGESNDLPSQRMNDRANDSPEDPLEFVMDLLKLARAVKPMTSSEIVRSAQSLAGPKLDPPSRLLDRSFRGASTRLRALWNDLRRESDGEPAWTDDWMPSFLHVDRWALSVEGREPSRLRTIEFLETLKDRLVQAASDASRSGAQSSTQTQAQGDVRAPQPEAMAQRAPVAPTWEELSETSQRILAVLGKRTMLGKNIASAMDPQWTHDSIGKQLSFLVTVGVLKKVGTRSGYRIERWPPGAPVELSGPQAAE
jgi:hypothetical protein